VKKLPVMSPNAMSVMSPNAMSFLVFCSEITNETRSGRSGWHFFGN
jgi:hypothetical protein